jgi:hypothetical protein
MHSYGRMAGLELDAGEVRVVDLGVGVGVGVGGREGHLLLRVHCS